MKKIVCSEKCYGCMACKSICPFDAIETEWDDRGFLVPKIETTKCRDCGLCTKACPAKSRKCDENENPIKAYAARLIAEKQRMESQSGGVFTALAEVALEQTGIVYAVAMKENNRIGYRRIDSFSSLKGVKGSKYVQAETDDAYKNIEADLREEKRVLFSGTPCFIDGLYGYLQNRKCSAEKLWTCDIVCHGVPGQGLWLAYIDQLKQRYKRQIVGFTFRDKSFGWRRNISGYHVGKRRMITENWARLYESQCCLREICYKCPYANIQRKGDVSIGDYWGIEKIHPELDDDTGVSLVLINTDRGEKLFKAAAEKLSVMETALEDCLQPNLMKPTEKPEEYEDFWKCVKTEGMWETAAMYTGFNMGNDWEYIEKRQIVRRIFQKLESILKKRDDML